MSGADEQMRLDITPITEGERKELASLFNQMAMTISRTRSSANKLMPRSEVFRGLGIIHGYAERAQEALRQAHRRDSGDVQEEGHV